mgnify:CR=1 FL=1|jgi:hypothetical protein|tara:strand:+ start:5042 stop:5692 length:651 start_codon:yes stop_codon:yes gene_type:complete
MADLRLHPTVNKMYGERAMQNVREQYKGIDQGLRDIPTELHLGSIRGPGFSETYPVGSTDPTQKGKVNQNAMRIELQKARGFANPSGLDKLRTILAAETTHQMTETDPTVRGIKMQLLESLGEDTVPFLEMQKRYAQTVDQLRKEGRPLGSNWESFENALNGPLGDWLLFERVFPELTEDHWRDYYEEGGGFDPKQMKLLNQLKRHLKEGSNVNQR